MKSQSVVLGEVTPGLVKKLKFAWGENERDNWLLGFGRGVIGKYTALESFSELIKRNKVEEDFGLLGIYLTKSLGATPIGFATATYLGDSTRTTKLFLYLDAEYRGQGKAIEALDHLLSHLFKGQVHRVEVELLSINSRAISFFRKFGFTQEGIKRSSYWMGINSFNVTLLRMLKPEWKRLKNGN